MRTNLVRILHSSQDFLLLLAIPSKHAASTQQSTPSSLRCCSSLFGSIFLRSQTRQAHRTSRPLHHACRQLPIPLRSTCRIHHLSTTPRQSRCYHPPPPPRILRPRADARGRRHRSPSHPAATSRLPQRATPRRRPLQEQISRPP